MSMSMPSAARSPVDRSRSGTFLLEWMPVGRDRVLVIGDAARATGDLERGHSQPGVGSCSVEGAEPENRSVAMTLSWQPSAGAVSRRCQGAVKALVKAVSRRSVKAPDCCTLLLHAAPNGVPAGCEKLPDQGGSRGTRTPDHLLVRQVL